MTTFKVVLEKCAEGGFVASCPAIPGCHSQGETRDETLANIKEAIQVCLEELYESIPTQNCEIVELAV